MVSRGKIEGDPRRDGGDTNAAAERRRAALLEGDAPPDEASSRDAAAPAEGEQPTEVEGEKPAETEAARPAEAEGEKPADGSLVRLSEADLRGGVEALLFSVSEPLPIRSLAELFGATAHEVRAVVEELRQSYIDEERAFRLEDIAGGVQIKTVSRFDAWIRRFHKKERDSRLSPAALETLAVIAYKQPINKADLEAIRGVGCSPILKTLLDRGLVQITGREETLGKPLLYGTTGLFLETFGLQSVKDLPQPELLSAKEGAVEADAGERRLLDEEPAEDQEEAGEVESDELEPGHSRLVGDAGLEDAPDGDDDEDEEEDDDDEGLFSIDDAIDPEDASDSEDDGGLESTVGEGPGRN